MTAQMSRGRLWAAIVLPLILVAVVIALMVQFSPAQQLKDPAAPPIENLLVRRVVLKSDGLVATVFNQGPDPITIAQVTVDDAYWQFSADPGPQLGALRSATLTIPYPWVAGSAHKITVLSSTGMKFDYQVAVALKTPEPGRRQFLILAVIGIFVGVIPVALGLLWFPVVKRLGATGLDVVLAFTVGLLLFLVLDGTEEALKSAGRLPRLFQGTVLFALCAATAYAALVIVGRWLAARKPSASDQAGTSRWTLALMIAVGIGLHNFSEGLAISAAFALGETAFGSLLILGFTLHNVTEGVAIISPIAKERPGVLGLLKLGLIGGLPTIAGAWLGGFVYSPVAAVMFLGFGVGAILQVIIQIAGQMAGEVSIGQRLTYAPVTLALLAGFGVMYLTGMLV